MGRKLPGALRNQVANRAQFRCEYCLFPELHFRLEVDHILSVKHGGAQTLENLAYACVYCNRYKRLFNPRRQNWRDHFELQGGIVRPLSLEAEATVRLLRINDLRRVAERVALQRAGIYPRN